MKSKIVYRAKMQSLSPRHPLCMYMHPQRRATFLRSSMVISSQLLPTLFLLPLASLISPSQSAACTSQHFSGDKAYTFCQDLPALNAQLHWDYDESCSCLSIAFIAPPARPDGWISWAINPMGSGMKGSQALIAFRDSASGMTVKTYNLTSYDLLTTASEVTWYEVKQSAADSSGDDILLFATLVLPEKGMRVVNHVWQVGYSVSGGNVPEMHWMQPDNLNSKGILDLVSGNDHSGGGGDSRTTRNSHGVLNVISWGIMIPVGVAVARFLSAYRSADPAWFYIHVSCQVSGYVLGVAGWGIGLKLGGDSHGITYSTHRNIGIALFSLATLQILALFLRPGNEHKYRALWNVYHHVIGYVVVALGIINVFQGFDILRPQHKWTTAYIVLIAVLGCIVVLLESMKNRRNRIQ